MRNAIHLKINHPCSENFEQFRKTEKGGFCNTCTKEVIDFTTMNATEIKAYFQNTTANTCGRFKSDQLKEYKSPMTTKQQRYLNFLGGFGLAMCALFISPEAFAQEKTNNTSPTEQGIPQKTVAQQTFSVNGTIFSEMENQPLVGADIIVKNSLNGTTTNFNGEFKLEHVKIGDEISIYYLGFEEKSITIKNKADSLKIFLKEEHEILGDIVIVGEVDTNQHYKTKRSFWQKIKSIF